MVHVELSLAREVWTEVTTGFYKLKVENNTFLIPVIMRFAWEWGKFLREPATRWFDWSFATSDTSLRQSFPWLCLFQAYFAVFPRVHTYTLKIMVNGRCACVSACGCCAVCVCCAVCCVLCVVCCVLWKPDETERNAAVFVFVEKSHVPADVLFCDQRDNRWRQHGMWIVRCVSIVYIACCIVPYL